MRPACFCVGDMHAHLSVRDYMVDTLASCTISLAHGWHPFTISVTACSICRLYLTGYWHIDVRNVLGKAYVPLTRRTRTTHISFGAEIAVGSKLRSLAPAAMARILDRREALELM